MGYCFMRFDKIKTTSGFEGKFGHNFRTINVPNADPSLRHLNEELIKMPDGETYESMYKRKIDEAYRGGTRPRKDAVQGLEFVVAYNPRTVDKTFDEEAWKAESVKWLQDTFGKENVISAVLHKDEPADSPHIHAVVIPMVNNRLNAKYYTGGKKAVSEMQTSYGKYMEKVGLERGIQFSHAKHTDIKRFYGAVNKEIQKELPPPEKSENAYEYRERANKTFIDSNLKAYGEKLKLERKITELNTKNAVQKYEIKKLRKEKQVTDKQRKQAERFEEIMKGLKNGYFSTVEENERFKKQMQDISEWQRERDRNEKESER